MPVVTVLMAVYNYEAAVRAAVESILAQTFTDFELLIVDDASTDRTGEVVTSIPDSRIVYLRNPTNQGLSRSLNRGLGEARGRYIARLDQDDRAAPDRLRRQVAVLDRHEDVALVGSWVRIIDEHDTVRGRVCYPLRPNLLRLLLVSLVHRPCFAHPAAMMRKTAMERVGGYDPRYSIAQDYDLWLKLARQDALRNVPAFLTDYREHRRSLSRRRREQARGEVRSIVREHAAFFVPETTPSDMDLLTRFLLFEPPAGTPERLREVTSRFFEAVRTTGPRRPDREHERLVAQAHLFYLPRLLPASPSVAADLWRTLPSRTKRSIASVAFLKMVARTMRASSDNRLRP